MSSLKPLLEDSGRIGRHRWRVTVWLHPIESNRYAFALAIDGGVAQTESGGNLHGCYTSMHAALNAGRALAATEIEERMKDEG